MQFKEVYTLVPNKKYKIVFSDRIHYKGTYRCNQGRINMFELKYKGFTYHKYFARVQRFYEPVFQKERIQSDMEQRAVNLILQRITGDPTFTW